MTVISFADVHILKLYIIIIKFINKIDVTEQGRNHVAKMACLNVVQYTLTISCAT